MKRSESGFQGTRTMPGRRTRDVMGPLVVLALLAAIASGCGSGGDGGGGGTNPLLTLGPAIHYSTANSQGTEVAPGDLNGDGLTDAAVIGERAGEQHILLYYQNTGGAFRSVVDIPVPDLAVKGIAVGDVNNDGRADLVVSGGSKTVTAGPPGRILVFYQNPANGTLGAPLELVVSSTDVGDPCIADLDSDGRKDIAVPGSPGTAAKGNISVFYQKNDGTLDQEFLYQESFVRVAGSIRAADMNNDGRNDLVFQSGDLELTVVRQLDNGALSAMPDTYSVPPGSSPSVGTFAVGDANADGKDDIVAVSSGATGFFWFFLQNAAAGLDPPLPVQLQQTPPDTVELADMNGDGRNDVVGALANYVLVFYQGPDHTFDASEYNSFVFRPSSAGDAAYRQSLATGDVTGDGLRDVLVTGGVEGLYVLPGIPQASAGTNHSILGKVVSGGAPLPGVTVLLRGAASKTATTDASGNYTFTNVGNGSYTVTPSRTGYTFSPTNRSMTVNGAGVTGQDFAGN